MSTTTTPRRQSSRRSAPRVPTHKLFVLDTNVLMHDPHSLFHFHEHDVYLPMMTLEELDNHKKGMTEVARNVRQVNRVLDHMLTLLDNEHLALDEGIPLAEISRGMASGRLYLQTEAMTLQLPMLAGAKPDNHILAVALNLQSRHRGKFHVILVSKDINMRIKAKTLGIATEDYFNDKALEDTDLLPAGIRALPDNFWDELEDTQSWQQDSDTYYRLTGNICSTFLLNEGIYTENGNNPFCAMVTSKNDRTAVLRTLHDFSHTKNALWGITARNREQNFALNLLMDPEIDFVTILGQAGTGKTLLALAAGLQQTLELNIYSEIIVTRATVSVGEDIGFLPGTETEKMAPWMGALEDNLEVLMKNCNEQGEWGKAASQEILNRRIKIKSMNFMRGRTFIEKFLVIDEAQNLTPKQMKTLITRAGNGTKVVCLGNLNQIDTPYLSEGSSGLTYVVDRFKGWNHSGHVTLQRGERSRLAEFAAESL
ncbi:MAG: PhoH family protein [Pseudomonadota bacterium]